MLAKTLETNAPQNRTPYLFEMTNQGISIATILRFLEEYPPLYSFLDERLTESLEAAGLFDLGIFKITAKGKALLKQHA